jgi:CelD/BcsL family acetyltransferase involved in cellulose biosynthesis
MARARTEGPGAAQSSARGPVILERLDPERVDWDHLDAFPDRLVFQTREWVQFVASAQGAEPVIAAIVDGTETCGYFTGLIVRRYGLSILGSPMPGWTTGFMGFNLEAGVSRRAATEALVEFAFGPLGCAHLELTDLRLDLADVEGLGFEHTAWRGLEVDLSPPEEEIFASFTGRCRTSIRKAKREGVVVEEADDIDFADDYHAQATEVFAKSSLVPPFGVERIRQLIEDVHPSGRLLLLRARNTQGDCIATGAFAWMNNTVHWLLAASWRQHQNLQPNEALMWRAMRLAKERGMEAMELGGFVDYKRKWGGREIQPPHLRKSRSRRVAVMRDLAQRAFSARQQVRGRMRSGRGRLRTPHD